MDEEKSWEEHFDDLAEYAYHHEDTFVPFNYEPNIALGRWVHRQRAYFKKNKLQSNRLVKLQLLGFTFDASSNRACFAEDAALWDHRYQELVEYVQKYGDADVSNNYTPNPALGKWVSHQRATHKNGKMSPNRNRRLNSIGFKFNMRSNSGLKDEQWDERFSELALYVVEHADADVPFNYKKNPILGKWVSRQRASHTHGRLGDERVKRLNLVGFDFKPKGGFGGVVKLNDVLWDRRYVELTEYYNENGNSNVPSVFKPNPSLGSWVSSQMSSFKAGVLAEERIERLALLDFNFEKRKYQFSGKIE